MPETPVLRRNDGTEGGDCMKDKWTAYWIAGLAALMLIGAAAVLLDRPGRKPEITVLTAESTAALTAAATDAAPAVKAAGTQTQASAAETAAEPETTAPPERNLNLADAEALKRVPGIGDTLADAIISARTACGGFVSRTQLCEISGIGETLMQRIMEEFEIPDERFPVTDAPPALQEEPAPEIQTEAPVYYINIYDANTVTRDELLTLPDMTGEKADAILTVRQNLKGFQGIYELTLAEGISGDYFEHVLKQYLYVEGDPYSVARRQEAAEPAA